jgi:MFS family permease
MLAESVERERVGSAFGLLQAMDSAGAIAGPALALLILSFSGLRTVFWLAAIPGALSILMVLRAVETGRRREEPKSAPAAQPKAPSLHPHLPGGFYFVLAAITLFSLGNSSDMFLILRAQSIGISPKFAPLLGLVFNVTYTAFSWPAGKLSDTVVARNGRGSRFVLAAAGYIVFAVVYLVFATAPSRAAIWAMMAFYGLFYSLTNPVLRAMVADMAPLEARGRAFGIFYFVTSIATLLASILTGELWKHFGPALPFHISAVLAIVAAIMLLGERAVAARKA